ncbi:MAG TPA: Wzz/FepE/Etk N-terminal domain-containing protein, partial [Burkholderiaceae bacterium]|nr:Wzz/FepE/Etk N-terminal domain-containing protein [Burkholderiaceae bacterium]
MTLTWRRLLQIMRARHWLVWGSGLLFTSLALAVCLFVLPKRYTASADVLLDIREPDPVQGQMQTPALLSAGYVVTQADIISSDRVTRKVVRALGLDTNPSAVQQWQDDGAPGTVEQYYMDALRRSLEVRPSRMSNVLSVKFTSTSPSYAASVANAWAKAYIETNVELKADPARDFKVWFDARTSQAR